MSASHKCLRGAVPCPHAEPESNDARRSPVNTSFFCGLRLGAAGLSLVLAFAGSVDVQGANARIKANNLTNLNVAGSWNAIPNDLTTNQWTNAYNQAGTLALGANLSWLGIQILDTAAPVVIGGANTLTLGRGGINLSSVDNTNNDLTIGTNLTLLANTNQIWSVAADRTLTLNGPTFFRDLGASVNVVVTGTGSVATTNITNDPTGMIGTWATFGTGAARYATVSGGVITGYTGGTPAATAAGVIDVSGAVNYDVAAAGALGAGASFNTLRYTGAAGTITNPFQANGLLNAGGALVMSGNITIGANQELVVNASNATITLSGNISNYNAGASGLTKTGVNTLTLSGDSDYTGVTTISAGSVILTSNNGLGSATGATVVIGMDSANTSPVPPVPAVPAGLLRLQNNITVDEPFFLHGLGNNSGYLINNETGTNTLRGLVTLVGAEAVRIGVNSGTQLNITGGMSGIGSFFVLNPTTNAVLAFTTNPVNLGAGGRFYLDTPGIAALGVTGNNWSTTTVAGGTLRTDVTNAMPAAATVSVGLSYAPGGTLNINGFDQTIGVLSSGTSIPGNRNVTSVSAAPATLTVNQATGGTYNGLISGNLALTKSGAGTLTLLNGDNSHSGDTVVSLGSLVLNNYAASPTQTGTITGTPTTTAATVTLASTTGLVAGQLVTGTGIPANAYVASVVNGTTITVGYPTATAPAAGAVNNVNIAAMLGSLKGSTLNYNGQGGTVQFGAFTTAYTFGGLKGSQNLSLLNTNGVPAPVALSIGANNQSTVYTGIMNGTGASINKVGNGVLELGGANTYTGGTTVSSGTLLATHPTASATGPGSVSTLAGSGATLGGTGSITGGSAQSITLNSGTFLAVGLTHGLNSGGPQDLSLGNSVTATNVALNLASVLQFDLFGNNGATATSVLGENDLLRLYSTSTANFAGSTLQVSATGLTSTAWNIGDTWMLIDWSGLTNPTTQFSGAPTFSQANLPTLAVGQEWTSFTDNAGYFIRIASSVPEPSRAILLFAGLSMLIMGRRRSALTA